MKAQLAELEAGKSFSIDSAREWSAELRSKEKHLEFLCSDADRCPSCGQEIHEAHSRKLVLDAASSLQAAVDQFPSVLHPFAAPLTASDCLDLSRGIRERLDSSVAVAKRAHDQLQSGLKQLELSIAHTDNDILRCENSYSKDVQELEKGIASAEALMGSQTALSDELTSTVASLQVNLQSLAQRSVELNDMFSSCSSARFCSVLLWPFHASNLQVLGARFRSTIKVWRGVFHDSCLHL